MTPATALRCPAGGRGPKPPAGASRPPGRALASASPGPTGLRGTVPPGRGKRVAFPFPVRTDESPDTAAMAGAIAPATVLRRDQDRPGAQSPRPAPALPPAGASPPTGPGAGLCPSRICRSTGHRPARAGGNAGRVSCSRPNRRKHCPRSNGRGHRPCQGARLILVLPLMRTTGILADASRRGSGKALPRLIPWNRSRLCAGTGAISSTGVGGGGMFKQQAYRGSVCRRRECLFETMIWS